MGQIIKNGINYSGGGDGINVDKTVLLENTITSSGQTLQYSQPIENFDYISITIHDSVGNSNCVCIPKENYASVFSIQTWIANNGYISFCPNTGEVNAANNCTIDNIIGYKFIASSGGGGSYPNVPIYLGGQVLFDSVYCSGTSRQNFWLRYKGTGTSIGTHAAFTFPIDIPKGYIIKYRLSASITTNEGNYLIIGINGVELLRGMTWNGNESNYTSNVFSDLFSFEDLPDEKAYTYSTENLAYNMYCQNDRAGNSYARKITIHGYLVKEA